MNMMLFLITLLLIIFIDYNHYICIWCQLKLNLGFVLWWQVNVVLWVVNVALATEYQLNDDDPTKVGLSTDHKGNEKEQ